MKVKGIINNLTPVSNLYLEIYDIPEENCFYRDYYPGKEVFKTLDAWKEIKNAKIVNAYIGHSEKYGMELSIYIHNKRRRGQ